MFGDASVVSAYQYRPPYPAETFEFLLSLLDAEAEIRAVLDAGCGPGVMARQLVPAVDRVDAVDIAMRMIAAGQALPGGKDPKLHWIHGAMEDVPLHPPYALIVAAASLHWMHGEKVLPRLHDILTPSGYLAVVDVVTEPTPWQHALGFIRAYSMNTDFQPYDIITVTRELVVRGLFAQHGITTTAPVPFRQSVAAYIESFHARNGLSRDRMDAQTARDFDGKLRELMYRYCPSGIIELQVRSRVVWGKPLSSAH